MPDFLLLRSEDLVILGLEWSGMRPITDPAGGIPRLEAVDDAAWLALTLPPQHTGEEATPIGERSPLTAPTGSGSVPVWRAALSGPSRLVFRVPLRTPFTPTVEGILDLIDRCPLVSPPGSPERPRTAIELPWRLIISPHGHDDLDVVAVHPARPVTADATSGLWRTRLRGADHTDTLDVVAVAETSAGAVDPFVGSLSRDERARLVTETAVRPARSTRIELSALGGTLVADGTWDNFEWGHHAVLGRDMQVRTLAKGALYPLGHRAEFRTFVERVFDSGAAAAVLRRVDVLTVTEPIRSASADPSLRRAFPFDDVEIVERTFTNLVAPQWMHPAPVAGAPGTFFWPTRSAGRILFPLRCSTANGEVMMRVPLLFVADLSPGFPSLTDPGVGEALSKEYGTFDTPIPGIPIDLVRSAAPQAEDVQEVHAISLGGGRDGSGFRPRVASLQVALPAMRALLGGEGHHRVRLAHSYLAMGEQAPVLLEVAGTAIDVDFAGKADRSGGLLAPAYQANAISRTLGPVLKEALPTIETPTIDPRALFSPNATILGFALSDLVSRSLKVPPQIISIIAAGKPPRVDMRWEGVALSSFAAFEASAATFLDMHVTMQPEIGSSDIDSLGNESVCTIHNFALALPPGNPVLRLRFAELNFTQQGGSTPTVKVSGVEVEFLDKLRLLDKLASSIDLLGVGPWVDVRPNGITAGYSLQLPAVSSGAFVLRNVAISAAISIPFDGRPVAVRLGFASRENRFALTVSMFGGGGYVEIELTQSGLLRVDLVLEFGALIEVDFVVARAEVHALGGVRFQLLEDQSVEVSGFLRIGGCVEILGLVSVSVEICLTLSYKSARNALVGRATVVVEVDLTLWSESVELDSGEWVLAGERAPASPMFAALDALTEPAAAEGDLFERFRTYRAAFARPVADVPA